MILEVVKKKFMNLFVCFILEFSICFVILEFWVWVPKSMLKKLHCQCNYMCRSFYFPGSMYTYANCTYMYIIDMRICDRYAQIYKHIYFYKNAHVCICIYKSIYIYMYARTWMYVYTCTYLYSYKCKHAYMTKSMLKYILLHVLIFRYK